MLAVVAAGQSAAKGLFNPGPNVQDAVTYTDRGIAKHKKGDLEGALADFSEAIQLNPKYAAAYRNKANAEKRKGDLRGANADFNRALRLGVTGD